MILATKKLNAAIGKIPAQISGSIQTQARARMMNKTAISLRLVSPIALRQAYAANVELPGGPYWTRLHSLIEHMPALVHHRIAIRDALPLGVERINFIKDGPNRSFRRASQANDPEVLAQF